MKYLPIIFGIDFNDNIPMLFGSFCKFIYYSHKNNWPLIVQEQYLSSMKKYNNDFLDEVFEINEIKPITDALLSNTESYKITKEETNLVIKEFGNKNIAWINLMNKKSNQLYKILDQKLKIILKKHKDLKAIIVWRHNHTISLIAKKYGLKLIEMELSAVRKRAYEFGLSYFQFSKKYSKEELNKRYNRFMSELSKYKNKLPVLTRKEIQNMILSKDRLNSLKNDEMYDFGIALGLNGDYETLSSNSPKNEDMLKEILKIENPKNILIRKHPLDANYKFKNEEKFNIDNSKSSIDFITKCHRIVSSVSNTNFEAMILGKTCYTLGNMPFARFSYENLNYNDEYVINLYDLNFLVFCYYVPYSLCLEQDYLDFRLSNPSEIDIYMRHYDYIIKKYIQKDCRKSDFADLSIRSKYLRKKCVIDDLNNKLKNMDDERKAVLVSNEELNFQINDMINSKSWKLTEPLRKLTKYISKMKK